MDVLGDERFSNAFELINDDFRRPLVTLSSEWPTVFSPVGFSSDGRLLSLESSYENKKVTLLDMSTGEPVLNFPRWGPVSTWALSPDGMMIAIESPNGSIALWDISSGKQHVTTAPAHQKGDFSRHTISSLAFSPDSRMVASGGQSDYLVKLWDVATGEHVTTFSGMRGSVISLAFSPDGHLLAAYSAGSALMLCDVANRQQIALIDAHERFSYGVPMVAFSPDGKLIATAGTGG